MKRSEMLDKIQNVLINLGLTSTHECGCCPKEATIEDAEAILHHIEYSGMLPPDSGFTGDETLNEWEPEND